MFVSLWLLIPMIALAVVGAVVVGIAGITWFWYIIDRPDVADRIMRNDDD